MLAIAVFPPPPTQIVIVFMLLMTSTLYFLTPAFPLSNLASRHHGLQPYSPEGLPPAAVPCHTLPGAATKPSPLVCCYRHLSPPTAISLICSCLLSVTKSVTKSRPPPLSHAFKVATSSLLPLSSLVCHHCPLSWLIGMSWIVTLFSSLSSL
jgi:hypothetical protein